ncbi:MAG: hypothetical protein JRC57_02835 [Deltaproteobacteria bacterium]|nr:hypothetical protein [Deltaproteobacteria bacterium]
MPINVNLIITGITLCCSMLIKFNTNFASWTSEVIEGSRGMKILCVDLCEKNFPKYAKTCYYVENLPK